MMSLKLIFLICIWIGSTLKETHADVIGIDLGSDTFKVAIVQPGSPLDIGFFYYALYVSCYRLLNFTISSHKLSI